MRYVMTEIPSTGMAAVVIAKTRVVMASLTLVKIAMTETQSTEMAAVKIVKTHVVMVSSILNSVKSAMITTWRRTMPAHQSASYQRAEMGTWGLARNAMMEMWKGETIAPLHAGYPFVVTEKRMLESSAMMATMSKLMHVRQPVHCRPRNR